MSMRAGHYIQQPTGYKAFVPAKLPPDNPPLDYDDELLSLVTRAERSLGLLNGITQTLPNPDLFVSMYVKKEALLSSQIEGTQASLAEVLEITDKQTQDVLEVTNYVNALNYGLSRLHDDDFPLCLRLIREIHGQLLSTGRGSERTPGEFRTTQNWIGSTNSTLQNAQYIPPSVDDMKIALDNLEKFMLEEDNFLPLVKIALIHAQFETIHPFLDGNGRVGRLLITFWLCQQDIISKPVLYLSYFFKRNKTEYYSRLMDVRLKGEWEGWIKFFLKGIIEISNESASSAKEIDLLQKSLTSKISQLDMQTTHNAQRLLNQLFLTPQVTRQSVAESLGISYSTANNLIAKFCNELNILEDVTPYQSRNKKYLFRDYMDILEVGTD